MCVFSLYMCAFSLIFTLTQFFPSPSFHLPYALRQPTPRMTVLSSLKKHLSLLTLLSPSLTCTHTPPPHRGGALLVAGCRDSDLHSKQVISLFCSFCRGYDEIGWSNKLPCPLPPPVSTLETKPDPIATRLNVKRLEDGPLVWQVRVLRLYHTSLARTRVMLSLQVATISVQIRHFDHEGLLQLWNNTFVVKTSYSH